MILRLFSHPAVVRIMEWLTLLGGHGPGDGHGHFGVF